MKIIIFILVLIFSCYSLYADRRDIGTTSYNFLKLTGSSRAASLASAFTAVPDDISSVFYNPAGAVSLRTNNVSMNYVKYFMDVTYQSIFFNLPYNDKANFFAGVFYLDGGEIKKFLGGDIQQGKARFYNLAVFLGYGSTINNVNYAGSLKILNETIVDDSLLGFAFDFGLLINILDDAVYMAHATDYTKYLSFSDIKFGCSFKNVGYTTGYGETNKDKLPFTTTIGLSSKFMNNYFFALDYLMPTDNTNKFKFGAEYYLNEYLTLRGGYNFKQEMYEKPFTFGAGIKFFLFYDMLFDISYEQNNVLGDVTGLNITVIF